MTDESKHNAEVEQTAEMGLLVVSEPKEHEDDQGN